MLGFLNIFILFNFYYIFVECGFSSSDDLKVLKLDKKLIERKRQDTLDMCRIFAEETKKENMEKNKKAPAKKYEKMKKHDMKEMKDKKPHVRPKRAVGTMFAVNPALNREDEQRVEKIVDKIYDDLEEKGQKVSYRRKELPKVDEKENGLDPNQTGRRFDFAPAVLLGPTTTRRPVNYSLSSATGPPPRFKHGIVPYFINSKNYDAHLSEIIIKAFDYFEKATCIRLQRLRERPVDRLSLNKVLWLYITNPSGIRQCVHSNDRAQIKGAQLIVFGYDCMSLGDIVHEIMHVLGFPHEHMRPDRDQYITILWDNIKPGYRKYFTLLDKPVIENLPYDYASVLHYPPRAFSRNGQVTILTEPNIKIGQREGLSEMDVEKVSMLYSNECVQRNREYLLKTCPSAVKSDTNPKQPTQQEIEDYFEDRLWPFGVVNYKLRDKMEFTTEEIENIKAVIRHIEKETCIEFRDLTTDGPAKDEESSSSESINVETNNVNTYVQLGVGSNETMATLPDWTSTEEEDLRSGKRKEIQTGKIGRTDAKIKDDKGKDNKGKDSKGKDNKAKDSKGKDSKVKDNKGKDNKVKDDKGKDNNNGKNALEKDIKLDKDKKPGGRVKRAAPPPPSPSRRHANSVLVLTRSPWPGCQCPRPGRPEGTYVLMIQTDCFNTVNDLLHLFVHTLGLDHQHNMHDRDSFLHIVWDQLTEDVKKEMKKKLPPAASVGYAYDYQSVMHYPWLEIKNGRTNIMYPIWNDGWAMGRWQGLSSTDVQKLELLYYKQCIERRKQAEQPER